MTDRRREPNAAHGEAAKHPSGSTPQPSPAPRPDTSSVSEMLTPSEIEQLRRHKKEVSDFAFEEFRKNPF